MTMASGVDTAATGELDDHDGEKKVPAKVTVSLKPAGNAPLLKQRKFLVERSRTVSWLLQWLRKTLRCEPDETVFVYVAQSFAPSPDQSIDTLYECYGVGDKLILHYCKTQAWG